MKISESLSVVTRPSSKDGVGPSEPMQPLDGVDSVVP